MNRTLATTAGLAALVLAGCSSTPTQPIAAPTDEPASSCTEPGTETSPRSNLISADCAATW